MSRTRNRTTQDEDTKVDEATLPKDNTDNQLDDTQDTDVISDDTPQIDEVEEDEAPSESTEVHSEPEKPADDHVPLHEARGGSYKMVGGKRIRA